jgi:hypothetical protein
MRQAREEEPHLWRLPPALPTGHEPQGLFVLTEGRCDHGTAIVGVGAGHRLAGRQGAHQHGVLRPAFLLGGAHAPWACGPTAAVRRQDGGALSARAGGGLPRPKSLPQLAAPPALADCGAHLIPAAAPPMEPLGHPQTPVEAEPGPLPPLVGPPQAAFHLRESRFSGGDGSRFPAAQRLVEDVAVITRGQP